MAYEYDRYEKEEGGGSFLMGLLAGTVLGAGLGMLFAPKAGTELRNQIGESAGRLRSTAGDTYSQATEKVSKIVDRGREAYDRARSSVGSGRGGDLRDTGTLGKERTASTGSMTGAGATGGFTSNRG
jgi:gas vesicle protein